MGKLLQQKIWGRHLKFVDNENAIPSVSKKKRRPVTPLHSMLSNWYRLILRPVRQIESVNLAFNYLRCLDLKPTNRLKLSKQINIDVLGSETTVVLENVKFSNTPPKRPSGWPTIGVVGLAIISM